MNEGMNLDKWATAMAKVLILETNNILMDTRLTVAEENRLADRKGKLLEFVDMTALTRLESITR